MTYDLTTGLGRLQQLRDDLEALDATEKKPIRFHMGTWKNDRHACGTSACAVGYCAMQPWAQEQGLSLVKESIGFGQSMIMPAYRHERNFTAAALFFGLVDSDGMTSNDIYYLFDDGVYEEDDDDGEPIEPTIKDVLIRIDEVIARHPGAAR